MVDVTVYWRPGCGFCTSLRTQLDRLGVAYQAVNVWDDAEASAAVRRANGGNELVPTVKVGDACLSNPTVTQVLTEMHRVDPDTDVPKPPASGRVASTLWRLLGGGTPDAGAR